MLFGLFEELIAAEEAGVIMGALEAETMFGTMLAEEEALAGRMAAMEMEALTEEIEAAEALQLEIDTAMSEIRAITEEVRALSDITALDAEVEGAADIVGLIKKVIELCKKLNSDSDPHADGMQAAREAAADFMDFFSG